MKRLTYGSISPWTAVLTMLLVSVFLPAPEIQGESGTDGYKFKVGETPPDFTTLDMEGKEYNLYSFRGKKVVFLNFWGVRCGACIDEMPHLEALSKMYADKGLVVFGVDTDGIDAPLLRKTMKEVGIDVSYPLLLDLDFSITDVYTNFLVPLSLIIDKEGVIQYTHVGFKEGDEKQYEKRIRQLLGIKGGKLHQM
jgi:peroxiredoxin